MLLPVLLLLLSLGVLYFGADFLVKGSSSLAVRLGVTPLVVGLTVVAFGTSAPELLVSVRSAWNGVSSIAVGNVIGSNLFNVCLILGISAVIRPLHVHRQLLRLDLPVMLAASLLFVILFWNGTLNRVDGIFFLIALGGYLAVCVMKAKRGEIAVEGEVITVTRSWWMDVLFVLGGLALLVWGADLLVNNAIVIARFLGWSEAVIGLTIVAAGTSVPELATSLVAALKKHADIAIGNIVGSNIFNILAVLGATAVVTPISTDQINYRDMGFMLLTSLLLLPFMRTGYRVSRTEGAVLFLLYAVYLWMLLMH